MVLIGTGRCWKTRYDNTVDASPQLNYVRIDIDCQGELMYYPTRGSPRTPLELG